MYVVEWRNIPLSTPHPPPPPIYFSDVVWISPGGGGTGGFAFCGGTSFYLSICFTLWFFFFVGDTWGTGKFVGGGGGGTCPLHPHSYIPASLYTPLATHLSVIWPCVWVLPPDSRVFRSDHQWTHTPCSSCPGPGDGTKVCLFYLF